MEWHEILGLTSNIATTVGVFLAVWSLKLSKKQATTSFEDDMTREYRGIINKLPIDALLDDGKHIEITPIILADIYHYIDLCNEQIFLRKKKRITDSTWLEWTEGIKNNMKRELFRDAWNKIKDSSDKEQFSEFRQFEENQFSGDPRFWGNPR
jgi:hypothetical protein